MIRDKYAFSRNLIFTLLALMTWTNSYSATVTLKGKLILAYSNLPTLALLHSYADESYSGTAIVAPDSSFTLKVEVNGTTSYNLRVGKANYDFLLTDRERECDVFINITNDHPKSIEFENSHENDAYRAFVFVIGQYDTRLSDLFKYCDGEDSCEKVLNEMLTGYSEKLADVRKTYKGTYTADVLCSMMMPSVAKNVKNTMEEFRKGFFEKVTFNDPTILNTAIYKDMISAYIGFLIEPSLSKEEQFLKYLEDKIKANPVVLHKSAGIIFEELLRQQKEKMLSMFIQWYNSGDNKKAIDNPVLDAKVKNVSLILPGQHYIDAVGPDTSGTTRSLKEIVDKSKCTLLLFWSSECPHCREEMPHIKEYYEKYHAKGFDIFAISMDPDPEKWKAFIKAKELPWTHIIISQATTPNPAVQYVISSTPTMVLIDHSGKILHRFMPKNKLEQHIIDALR